MQITARPNVGTGTKENYLDIESTIWQVDSHNYTYQALGRQKSLSSNIHLFRRNPTAER